jgi:hypothetical protein
MKGINRNSESEMRRLYAAGIIGCLLAMEAFLYAGESQSARPTTAVKTGTARIVVSPDMLVSRDGDIPHVELMVAANPTNPNNLVGAAITNTRPDGGWACKAYASLDGGNRWIASSFPDQVEWGGSDPQVAFGVHGTAYFTALNMQKDEQGNTHSYLYLSRSEDGGIHWQPGSNLGYSYDHEQITVDRTFGKFAGRVYLGVLHGYPVYRVGVFRSDDDGRTFTGPVDAASGEGRVGINVVNLLVLSDGSLFVPYNDFDFMPELRKNHRPSGMWFIASSDGGVTFSQPRRINEQRHNPDRDAGSLSTFPVYAVDNQSDKFRDGLYVVWNDYRFGKSRLLFSYSTDRGMAWTEPRLLDPSVPDSAVQFQPMMVVNKQGAIGVTWFDSRNSTDGNGFDEYFSTSTDGGGSFLPPVRVSSETSNPAGSGNLAISPHFATLKINPPDQLIGKNRISLLSARSRWGNGGDYMGLTADATGAFHPFWADSRTGTFQIHTAVVKVEQPEESAEGATKQFPGSERLVPKVKTDVTDRVEFVFDPTRYNAATNELELPIRLRNKSQQTIYSPIVVRIEGFGSGMGDGLKEYSPTILNASDGKPGNGATYDYTKALGSEDSLDPSSATGAVVWKLKVKDPEKIPDLHIVVEGMLSSRE